MAVPTGNTASLAATQCSVLYLGPALPRIERTRDVTPGERWGLSLCYETGESNWTQAHIRTHLLLQKPALFWFQSFHQVFGPGCRHLLPFGDKSVSEVQHRCWVIRSGSQFANAEMRRGKDRERPTFVALPHCFVPVWAQQTCCLLENKQSGSILALLCVSLHMRSCPKASQTSIRIIQHNIAL